MCTDDPNNYFCGFVVCVCCGFKRDRLELREAKALMSAQQTSLEIIVNMCCSDGEIVLFIGEQVLGGRHEYSKPCTGLEE